MRIARNTLRTVSILSALTASFLIMVVLMTGCTPEEDKSRTSDPIAVSAGDNASINFEYFTS